jgi:hypothetical protein
MATSAAEGERAGKVSSWGAVGVYVGRRSWGGGVTYAGGGWLCRGRKEETILEEGRAGLPAGWLGVRTWWVKGAVVFLTGLATPSEPPVTWGPE